MEKIDHGELACGLPYSDMEKLVPSPRRAAHYLVAAWINNEQHHKQWMIEKALESLGVDTILLRGYLKMEGYSPAEGIPP